MRHLLLGQTSTSHQNKDARNIQRDGEILEKTLRDRKCRLERLRRQRVKKEDENERLLMQIEDASLDASSVSSFLQEDYQATQAAKYANHSKLEILIFVMQRVMDDVITDKKLRDLSRQQKQEIAELQQVLETWHFRTFPIFTKHSSQCCPDQKIQL